MVKCATADIGLRITRSTEKPDLNVANANVATIERRMVNEIRQSKAQRNYRL